MTILESEAELEAYMEVGGVEFHINGMPTTVLFDNEYQATDQFGHVVIETSAPRVTLPTHVADNLGVEHDTEAIGPDDVCYLIKEPKPDGMGMTELRLVKQT